MPLIHPFLHTIMVWQHPSPPHPLNQGPMDQRGPPLPSTTCTRVLWTSGTCLHLATSSRAPSTSGTPSSTHPHTLFLSPATQTRAHRLLVSTSQPGCHHRGPGTCGAQSSTKPTAAGVKVSAVPTSGPAVHTGAPWSGDTCCSVQPSVLGAHELEALASIPHTCQGPTNQ